MHLCIENNSNDSNETIFNKYCIIAFVNKN